MNTTFSIIFFLSLLSISGAGFALYKFIAYCDSFRLADWGSTTANRLAGVICWFVYRYHRLPQTPIPLPETGAAIVACNHISGLDPLVLIAATPRPLRFMIAREEYERFGLQWLFRLGGCIPVERDKRPELAMRAALRAIKENEVIAMFPHGGIHLPSQHRPAKIKGGAIRLAQITGTAIYPIHVEGIKGEGHTMLAIPLRSHVNISTHPPLYCNTEHNLKNMRKLQELIETSTHVNN